MSISIESSQSSLSFIMFLEFEHDVPLQYSHITDHSNLAFLQLQVFIIQPLRHLQNIMLSTSGGAGFLSVVMGASPFGVTFHPQEVGGKLFPIHFWTWWYVL